ncbi:ogr/Delta-like zinc finger family protein [Sphingomonas morindae]|uniref:Ogr/Delta-like zinc finger family protein n=1 Tax=Sphingomonas morindae TaxID=1541170 RepID=A0ABY4X6Z4_9SPHN|nr:ogr/Delta-like zinc finger family protein [Sphingomonas morindae]USI72693.1 ogr/Delta-like zinc finger family protein [Sphingomonas morindae]
MKRVIHRRLVMACPHCGTRALIRTSEQMTILCREIRFRCENDSCGHHFVAQLAIIHSVVASRTPNPEVRLPLGASGLRAARPRPANENALRPANDDHADAAPRADETIMSG